MDNNVDINTTIQIRNAYLQEKRFFSDLQIKFYSLLITIILGYLTLAYKEGFKDVHTELLILTGFLLGVMLFSFILIIFIFISGQHMADKNYDYMIDAVSQGANDTIESKALDSVNFNLKVEYILQAVIAVFLIASFIEFIRILY